MLTETARRQHHRRDDLRHASGMPDGEWALIEPHAPAAKLLGRPCRMPLRGVAEARTNIKWIPV
jgi:hypothetical protein